MARYYRRRYTRVVKPKKKWASNIRELRNNYSSGEGVEKAGLAVALCLNSTETNLGAAAAPTPVILKTGNYKAQLDVYVATSSANMVSINAYIMYIPEGVFTVSTLPNVHADYTSLRQLVDRHPEWILAWKQCGYDNVSSTANLEKVAFSSRLKRNLNSGDQIIFFVLARTDEETAGKITRLYFTGMCQFWTCAN